MADSGHYSIDSTTRSRACVGSGLKRWTHRRALGRSPGGFSGKLHCISDAGGRPLAFHLTGGEAADCKGYNMLIALPERTPNALLADKAMTPMRSAPTFGFGR